MVMSYKRFKLYKNKEKLKEYRKRHKQKYYNKNKENCFNSGKKWTDEEIRKILFEAKTDTELSIELGRSISAIQKQRHFAKENILDYI
jgi:hypothetical protein